MKKRRKVTTAMQFACSKADLIKFFEAKASYYLKLYRDEKTRIARSQQAYGKYEAYQHAATTLEMHVEPSKRKGKK